VNIAKSDIQQQLDSLGYISVTEKYRCIFNHFYVIGPDSRDVTKFQFEFDNVLTLTFSTDSKFDKCFKFFVSNANSWKMPCSTTDFICTESQGVQTNLFFRQIQPVTQTTVIECVT